MFLKDGLRAEDGIPMDLLKVAIEEKYILGKEREFGREAMTPMADCITSLLNTAYTESNIPLSWENLVLVPIAKKGDPSDPNDYRGISFMNTTLKIISIILSDRIHVAAEKKNLFTIQ